jgi:hypothetical protein
MTLHFAICATYERERERERTSHTAKLILEVRDACVMRVMVADTRDTNVIMMMMGTSINFIVIIEW